MERNAYDEAKARATTVNQWTHTLSHYAIDTNPSSENDFRFEIEEVPEPEMGCTHLVTMIELVVMPPDETWPVETVIDGEIIERFTTDDPYGAVEAAREVQVFTFEERMERAFEREQQEALRGI
jgi:hypothetical protein